MDQGDMQASISRLSGQHIIYSKLKFYNNHNKGEKCLYNQVGDTTQEVGFCNIKPKPPMRLQQSLTHSLPRWSRGKTLLFPHSNCEMTTKQGNNFS